MSPETVTLYFVPRRLIVWLNIPWAQLKNAKLIKCLFPILRCFNGGSCQDGVDSYTCSCPDDVSGVNCECGVAGDCINVNESVSWTVPPFYVEAVTEQVMFLDDFIHETSNYERTPIIWNLCFIKFMRILHFT